MRPEPLFAAIAPLRAAGATVVLLDPAGEPLSDALARELASMPRLALVCGRYEGIDERVRTVVDREVSIGDYVLTGGELPALVVVDAVSRLVPGVIEEASQLGDSFATGLLEHPQYTRPESFEGLGVPPILRSGPSCRGRTLAATGGAPAHPAPTSRPSRAGALVGGRSCDARGAARGPRRRLTARRRLAAGRMPLLYSRRRGRSRGRVRCAHRCDARRNPSP